MFELYKGLGFTAEFSSDNWATMLETALRRSVVEPDEWFQVMDREDMLVALFNNGRRVPIMAKQR